MQRREAARRSKKDSEDFVQLLFATLFLCLTGKPFDG